MSKLVSIIVAIYNVDQYLNKCIESILCQTYENLEIILVNDGSKDKSKLICEEYSTEDERIILINTENRGVSSARNTGLDIAKGEYITFVDGDDYICKDSIETMVKTIEKYNSDISICGYRMFSDKSDKSKISDDNRTDITMNSDETLKMIFNSNKINGFLWNKMFKSSIFKNLRLSQDMDICEDLYIVCEILSSDLKIHYTPRPLYNYRQNDNSATKSIDKLFLKNGTIKYIDAFDKIRKLLNGKSDIIELIRIRRIKTIMETYFLMIKNKYRNKLVTSIIYKELCKEKNYYLKNRNIPIKLKIAFILFILKLYMENLLINGRAYE